MRFIYNDVFCCLFFLFYCFGLVFGFMVVIIYGGKIIYFVEVFDVFVIFCIIIGE